MLKVILSVGSRTEKSDSSGIWHIIGVWYIRVKRMNEFGQDSMSGNPRGHTNTQRTFVEHQLNLDVVLETKWEERKPIIEISYD